LTRSEYCIAVDNLSHNYGSFKALDRVSFVVEYGKVFGLLGPNGAGKTTTIKLLTTLINTSPGMVSIFGNDISTESAKIKPRIGVVLQHPSSEVNLSVKQSLDLYGFLWNVPRRKRKERVIQILEAFDLIPIQDIKTDELSHGQRKRVQVAREFMHDMDLLFLDEPTVGLDVSSRRKLLDYVKNQVRLGLTVFFTTHIMEEAEYLCDYIAIMNNGKVLAQDRTRTLREKYSGAKIIEIELKNIDNHNALPLIRSMVGESNVESPENGVIKISSPDDTNMVLKTLELISSRGIEIENVRISPPTLEDVFLNILGKKEREENNKNLR
jgi:ABC-2 type transport system ATP-binding protein